MPHRHTFSRQTRDAARLLGTEIARARRARRWTMEDLAERAGITRVTLRKVENGDPTVALGIAFEVATLVGVALFGADPRQLSSLLHTARDRLALLPERVHQPSGPVHDDF